MIRLMFVFARCDCLSEGACFCWQLSLDSGQKAYMDLKVLFVTAGLDENKIPIGEEDLIDMGDAELAQTKELATMNLSEYINELDEMQSVLTAPSLPCRW